MLRHQDATTSAITLSVCLIVKDEERWLSRCLDSVRSVADEIVVVDTGSTDRTVEIARQYTDKVFFHPWNDDFGEARNVSLGYATGDWVLQVDADEVLEIEDVPLLNQVIQGSGYVAVYVALHNKLPDGTSRHYYPRLFRRGQAHYEGTVHEQLIHDGQATTAEIRIHHDGYNLDPQAMARKYQRTEALLQRRLQEFPDDLTATAQLVRVYREWGRFDRVLEYAPPAVTRCAPHTRRRAHHMLVSDLAYAHMQVGELPEGVHICREALAVHPQSLDLWFTLGGLYFRQQEFSLAAESLQRFLEVHQQVRQRPSAYLMMGTYGQEAQAWYNLGACYAALEQPEKALASHARACQLAPHRAGYQVTVAQLLLKQGRENEATVHLQKAIPLLETELLAHPSDGQRMSDLASCYLLLNRHEAARLGYQAALELDPSCTSARRGLAFLLGKVSFLLGKVS